MSGVGEITDKVGGTMREDDPRREAKKGVVLRLGGGEGVLLREGVLFVLPPRRE